MTTVYISVIVILPVTCAPPRFTRLAPKGASWVAPEGHTVKTN